MYITELKNINNSEVFRNLQRNIDKETALTDKWKKEGWTAQNQTEGSGHGVSKNERVETNNLRSPLTMAVIVIE